ncbi:MAG: carotenoid biosynthesis protein [Chloroflexi bacterium]|nr:carotenoid biosynthesis protein [Chloroflexota bacterium]
MTSLVVRMPVRLSLRLRGYTMLLVLWTLSMIALPLLRWTVGDSLLAFGVTMTVVLQAAAVLTALGSAWGVRRAAVMAGSIMVLAWLVEWAGSFTGVPFGAYRYTERLQPQLAGVPLLIPLAWLMMLPSAWALAAVVVGTRRRWRFALVAALAFTAWDLFLDPQMTSWGIWAWATPSGYFGIPWVNFLGWIVSSFLMTFILRPTRLPLHPLLFIYAVTWVFMTIGLAAFWGLPGPALGGFVGMGTFVALASLALWREERA